MAELTLLQVAYGEDHSKRLKEIDDYFLEMTKPKMFEGKKSAERLYIKNYEETCVFIQDHLHRDAKAMTVMEYYQSLAYLRVKLKPKNNKRTGKR